MESLTDKTAVVTGASSGFGYAIAKSLANAGVHLALGARRMDRLGELAQEIRKKYKVRVLAHSLDVTDPLNVSQWEFYVLATRVLDRECGEQKRISFSSLLTLSPVRVVYAELGSVIARIEGELGHSTTRNK